MKDYQIDEIAKLPTGVAVVYQNDWVAPVLCKIDMSQNERVNFSPTNSYQPLEHLKVTCSEVLKLLLKEKGTSSEEPNIDGIQRELHDLKIPTSLKIKIGTFIDAFKKGETELWKEETFSALSEMVTDLLSARTELVKIANKAHNFQELNQLLDRFITQRVSIPETFYPSIRHCLMKQYGETNETRKGIYNKWLEENGLKNN